MNTEYPFLLAPIPGELPFGIYLKGERSLYRGLRTHFNHAQAAYRALCETSDSLQNLDLQQKNRDAWRILAEQTEQVLTERSKDMEILAWFVAAQTHLDRPLPRLAAAFASTVELIEHSWVDLHPIPPDDKLGATDPDSRVREIDSLRLRGLVQLLGETPGSGLLYLPLTHLPLLGDCSYGSFVLAERNGQIKILRTTVTEEIVAETEDLRERITAMETMIQSLDRLDRVISPIAARIPGTSLQINGLRRHLTELLRAVRELVQGTSFSWPEAENIKETELEDSASAAPASSSVMAPAADEIMAQSVLATSDGYHREAALADLARLMAYFRENEPHSPVHTLLARALRWARLPLPELMEELLGSESDGLARIAMMAGFESAKETVTSASVQSVPVPPGSFSRSIPEARTTPVAEPDPIPQRSSPAYESEPSKPEPKIANFDW